MKVFHIITGLQTGGAEMMLLKLLSAIDSRRFESVVVSLSDNGKMGDRLTSQGMTVHTLDMKLRMPTPRVILKLRKLVREEKPCIIQGWMYHGNLAASISRILYGVRCPVIWNIRHSLYDIEYEKTLTRNVIKLGGLISSKASRILYNSHTSAMQHKKFGYDSKNTVIIPNGIDISKFKEDSRARTRICKELGIDDNKIIIGLIARYHPMKNHKLFLRAAAKLREKHLNVHFVLAGSNVNMNNQSLSKMVEELGLSSCVHLLGERLDIPEITATMDIACSSSLWGESFSNAIAEAMACGVPCVATDVGDAARIIGRTGYVIPRNNDDALVRAWIELIDMGIDERKKLGQLAQRRIKENYSIDNIVRQYESLYDEVIAETLRNQPGDELHQILN